MPQLHGSLSHWFWEHATSGPAARARSLAIKGTTGEQSAQKRVKTLVASLVLPCRSISALTVNFHELYGNG